MSVATFPFDAAEYLDDEASQADYLSDAFGTGDPAAMTYALGVVARARGMTQIARQAGVQREHLYRALSSDGHPEMATIVKVVQALGMRLDIVPVATAI